MKMHKQIPAKLARRRGTVMEGQTRFPAAVMDGRIFEDDYNIPERLRSGIARNPIMFGNLNGAGWFGNEPEAKAGGGANMYSNSLFGLGQIDNDLLYLGQTDDDTTEETFDWGDASMGAGGMAVLVLGGLALLKWKNRL